MEVSTELIYSSVPFFFVSMLVGKAGHRFGVPVLLLFPSWLVWFSGGDGFGPT